MMNDVVTRAEPPISSEPVEIVDAVLNAKSSITIKQHAERTPKDQKDWSDHFDYSDHLNHLPHFLPLEPIPIGHCNLACHMCTVTHRPDAGVLSLHRFNQVLNQLPDLTELHLQGLGELLLHPDFFTMVEHATHRGLRVSSNTNATLLTPTRARGCVTSGLASLSILLDSPQTQDYQAIRIGASVNKMLRNVRRLQRIKAELASRTPELRVVMVLMRRNLRQLPAMVDLVSRLGIDELLVQRLANDLNEAQLPARYVPIRNFVQDEPLTADDLAHAEQVFCQARQQAAQVGVKLYLPRLSTAASALPTSATTLTSPEAFKTGCSSPNDRLYVTTQGELLPCCMVATVDRARWDNVFEDSVQAVYYGASARAWRAALNTDEPPARCRHCLLYRNKF